MPKLESWQSYVLATDYGPDEMHGMPLYGAMVAAGWLEERPDANDRYRLPVKTSMRIAPGRVYLVKHLPYREEDIYRAD